MGAEIDFLAVGENSRSGDAIVVRYGNLYGQRSEQAIVVVDGGFSDSGKAIVDHIRNRFNTDYVDLVISSHPDQDHISGLAVVLEGLDVAELWMHLPWKHSTEMATARQHGFQQAKLSERVEKSLQGASDLESIAKRRGIPIVEPFTEVSTNDGAIIVAGPSQTFYKELEKTGKKSILFIMADDTKNADEVSDYLRSNYKDSHNAVLTIHTNKSGDISENVHGKDEKELIALRKQSNEIDSFESSFKVIVSVLMLKEGWDVRNVTTIVGLRPYSSKSKILPEQTLGRGLRRMYFGRDDVEEYVSVIGTPAFMDFVETLNREGVDLVEMKMGLGAKPITPTVIEIDNENPKKDIEKLDIEIPILTPRIQREYKNLNLLDVSKFPHKKIKLKQFSEKEQKEIIFKEIVDGKEHHRTILDTDIEPSYQSAIGFFAQAVMRELRLFGCYDILFGQVKEFVRDYLFESKVNLEDGNVLRNLSEIEATKTIIQTFKRHINELTVEDKGNAEIKNYIKVSSARPFVVNDRAYLIPKKSVFNKIVGDSHFELQFADFLEKCEDIVSYAKNYDEVHFKIDYKNADGAISNYQPDFFVKVNQKLIYIVETKGREDLDDPLKIERLKQWCEDASERQKRIEYKMLYVKQEEYEKYKPKSFGELINS